MRPYGGPGRAFLARAGLLFFVVIIGVTSALAAPQGGLAKLRFRPDDADTRAGFEHFYNLEYDQAIHSFEEAVKSHPNDAFALNHLLSGVMFQELYRIGALDTELYAKNGFLTSKQFPIDPKAKERILGLMEQSLQLSEGRLRKNPNDVDALYTRGVVRGYRATYIGLIDKAWFAALRSAVAARHDHERVLELDPKYSDAKMTVGIHSYVIASVSWPVKAAASVVGLSGNKQRGIQYLYEAGEAGGEAAIDSKIALSLFLRREQRYPEALKLVGGLAMDFPRNFLFRLEDANLMNAAGQGPEAIAAFRKIIIDDEAGTFAKGQTRMEMVHYGLADALRGQRLYEEAAREYDTVGASKRIDPDLRERAQLGAGEMYDLMKKRDQAVRRYQELLASDESSDHAGLAKKYLKQPYSAQ
jgi:tetratricopeptide (TPR) repeat protein